MKSTPEEARSRRLVRWLGSIADAGLLRVPRFFGLVYGPIEDDLPIRDAWRRSRNRRMPAQAGWWYAMGGATYFLFMMLIATGVLLSGYYRPSIAEAYPSLQYLESEVTFGWLVRGVHYWAANLVIFMVMAHFLRAFVTAAYRTPRETNWLIGLLLLLTLLAFGMTGYLLPWDQWAYWATSHELDALSRVPLFGGLIAGVLRADDFVSGATLSRFFSFHVIGLPWIALLLLVLHFQLLRKHGISTPRGRDPIPGEPFFPNHMLKQLIVALLCIGVVISLAALRPRPFSGPADGFNPPETLQVLWFPLAVSRAATHYLGGFGLVILLGVFASMALVPLAFRTHERNLMRRRVRTVIAAALVLTLTSLWILGERLTDPLYGPEEGEAGAQLVEPVSGDGAESSGEGAVDVPHEGTTDEGEER